ncbi:hypothetical protein CBER1_04874 [Cercospora berteroae]|uniref:YTH domain-containing protein n=1 Tax=Cercospora berteroae TaxID=357750 RepID=A0A2S6BRY2_9PEZI|nr:hypothetical protein CBER1_04874 [Cercospora berteroae]
MEDFNIDWSNPMAMFAATAPMQSYPAEEVDDGEDSCYAADNNSTTNVNGQSEPGAVEQKPPEAISQSDAAKKLENQKRAEILRAKLVAMRQNTPAKASSAAALAPANAASFNTPTKSSSKLSPTPIPQLQQQTQEEIPEVKVDSDLEALLAAGKAQADAHIAATKQKELKTGAAEGKDQHQTSTDNGSGRDSATARVEATEQLAGHHTTGSSTSTVPQTNLADSYYTDLAAWLDMTGYHDVEYRNSKLRTYKERKALEAEAARIAEKLEKLREAEQAEMQQMRIGTPNVKRPNMAPPLLPQFLSNGQATPQQVNGTKRARSPETTLAEKRQREENGFRIRGAKDSPQSRPGSARRGRRSPSPGHERRVAYPDARRRSSIDDRGSLSSHSRDPSLERRAQYYRRDDDQQPRYDHYNPRDGRFSGAFNAPRPGRAAGREVASSYRPSAGLELQKGGVRYFILKSWNHQNVEEAQRTNIWATQEKNEEMLTHAFKTARHVILLFSVNKSMAFQGYALMTCAPDPRIQKPAFTAKLNWATSPAFTLRWLAKTPIHFKLVGHIKNTRNYDEDKGEPHAVLVGKDGQEVNADAGRGVVRILDDAEVGGENGNGTRL